RRRVLLWACLGHAGGDRASPLVGCDRTADLLVAVRPQTGCPEAPATASLDVSDQAGAGRRPGGAGGETAAIPRQTGVGGRGRGLRQAALRAASAQAGGDVGGAIAEGLGAVRSAAGRAAGSEE